MNIREQLLVEHSKKNSELIANYCISKSKLAELLKLLWAGEPVVSQRASMAVSAYYDKQAEDFKPYLAELIHRFTHENQELAVKRACIRLLQFEEIPEAQQSELFDKCISLISQPNETTAVLAFAMQVILNLCQKHPELSFEAIPLIEDLLNRNKGAGIQNRGKKVLKKLRQI